MANRMANVLMVSFADEQRRLHSLTAKDAIVPAVIGGLVCSPLLSRFVLPVLYTMWVRDGAPPEIDFEKELTADWQAPTEEGNTGHVAAPAGA